MADKVTAYDVEGEVDYGKLVKQFGAQFINEKLYKRVKNPHRLFRRGFIYAHRDFDKLLDYYDKHKKFAIVSGRGVSNNMHLAHLLLWEFNKHMQDTYNSFLFVPFSDDEKYMYKKNRGFKEIQELTLSNAKDIIALGFDPKKTKFMFDTVNLNQDVYNLSVRAAKRMTNSTVKSAFGFTGSNNIGTTFYPAMQAAHILWPTHKFKVPSLVQIGIDQDVFIKLTRDVSEKMGYMKPSCLLTKFVMGLDGSSKMSASKTMTSLYTTDDPDLAVKKVKSAFTGGRDTLSKQKQYGGKPEICPVHEYLKLFFIEDDKEIAELYRKCKAGEIMCGECKEILAKYVRKFLVSHQKKRDKALDKLDKYMLKF